MDIYFDGLKEVGYERVLCFSPCFFLILSLNFNIHFYRPNMKFKSYSHKAIHKHVSGRSIEQNMHLFVPPILHSFFSFSTHKISDPFSQLSRGLHTSMATNYLLLVTTRHISFSYTPTTSLLSPEQPTWDDLNMHMLPLHHESLPPQSSSLDLAKLSLQSSAFYPYGLDRCHCSPIQWLWRWSWNSIGH